MQLFSPPAPPGAATGSASPTTAPAGARSVWIPAAPPGAVSAISFGSRLAARSLSPAGREPRFPVQTLILTFKLSPDTLVDRRRRGSRRRSRTADQPRPTAASLPAQPGGRQAGTAPSRPRIAPEPRPCPLLPADRERREIAGEPARRRRQGPPAAESRPASRSTRRKSLPCLARPSPSLPRLALPSLALPSLA